MVPSPLSAKMIKSERPKKYIQYPESNVHIPVRSTFVPGIICWSPVAGGGGAGVAVGGGSIGGGGGAGVGAGAGVTSSGVGEGVTLTLPFEDLSLPLSSLSIFFPISMPINSAAPASTTAPMISPIINPDAGFFCPP